MHNELFTIGSFTVYGYGLMIMIGFVVAIASSMNMVKQHNRTNKTKLNGDVVLNMAMLAIVFGIIGGKLLYCIVNIERVIKNPTIIISNGGFVVYGGIILGTLACFLFAKKYNIDFLSYTDIILPNVFIAQGFGRIGCFLAGCCYGMEYNGIGSIMFHDSYIAPNNIPLFPSQLISSAFDFVMGIILIVLYFKIKTKRGTTTSLYIILYGIGRFIIEFFRGDIERGFVFGITTSQLISIFAILLWIVINMYLNKRNNQKL